MGQQAFIFIILVATLLLGGLAVVIWTELRRGQFSQKLLGYLKRASRGAWNKSDVSDSGRNQGHIGYLSAEEKTKAELKNVQSLVESRKQLASDTDISHHVWNLYKNHFRFTSPQSLDPSNQDGDLYGVKILSSRSTNGLNTYEFELNGARYRFVDDENSRTSADNVKFFSVYLYDDTGSCLIELPMKLKVDRWGRHYSISPTGPRAFLPDGWTHDFINATLIHQSNRNKEIREQKHQERLSEIEDLKTRFGISDP